MFAGRAALGADTEGGRARNRSACRPGLAAVMGHDVEDRRANVTATDAVVEDGPGDDRIAVAPGSDVLLVIKCPDATKRASAGGHTRGSGPRLATVGRLRH